MNKEGLLSYLAEHGKNLSWEELANKFEYKSGEAARQVYKEFRIKRKRVRDKQVFVTERRTDNELILNNVLYDVPPEPADIIKDFNIDMKKFKLSYYWSIAVPHLGKYRVSVATKSLDEKEDMSKMFMEFLREYKVRVPNISDKHINFDLDRGVLILNKQDAHLNKLCLTGNNSIKDRMNGLFTVIMSTLRKAKACTNLEKIVYIVGSDLFNSEWTRTTTRGTPQENILSYEESFARIVEFEINIIQTLRAFATEVEIIYVPGNHDKYVGWHLAHSLSMLYKDAEDVTVDISMDYTKYKQYYDTAICLNHGYSIKPEQLVNNFPVEFKQGFSSSNYWYVLIGDKHVEEARTYGSIRFYTIPALSKAVSDWDLSKGYSSGIQELTAFIIQPGKGINSIFKEPL
jgi:UDP-2,3-diacylglucosamine pyrophosphatase LpxH